MRRSRSRRSTRRRSPPLRTKGVIMIIQLQLPSAASAHSIAGHSDDEKDDHHQQPTMLVLTLLFCNVLPNVEI